jgi:four helix bundle protein
MRIQHSDRFVVYKRLSVSWLHCFITNKVRYLKVQDLDSYKIAYMLSNYVWNIVVCWNLFEKKTLGDQFVRAIDSISANLAEGYGRYGKKDKIKFYYYSFGSLRESEDWLAKATARRLLTSEQSVYIKQRLELLPKYIYQLIQYTNEKLKE